MEGIDQMSKLKASLKRFGREVIRKKVLFLMLLPTIVYFIVFCYIPMPGAYVAFVDYVMSKRIVNGKLNSIVGKEYMEQGSALLLYEITKALFDYCFSMLDKIGNMVNEINKQVFTSRSKSMLATISRTKMQTYKL